MYTDEEGGFIHIVVGAAIGGVGNLAYQAFTGNIGSIGDGFAAFGIGAVAGGVGAATGGASLAAMGTASSVGGAIGAGALSGAVGGASAGFLQNTGNALYFQNSSLGDALGSGLQGALYGGLGGAVLGGIAGGIAYKPTNTTAPGNAVGTVADDAVNVAGSEIGVPGFRAQFPDILDDAGNVLHQGGSYVTQNIGTQTGSAFPSSAIGQGGLNLFKFGSHQATRSTGWRVGDRFLNLPSRGSPQLNWKQNSGFLRQEMKLGAPIHDTFLNSNGLPRATGGFLNAERFLLQSRGWSFNPSIRA